MVFICSTHIIYFSILYVVSLYLHYLTVHKIVLLFYLVIFLLYVIDEVFECYIFVSILPQKFCDFLHDFVHHSNFWECICHII